MSSSHPIRILLAEDDANLRMMLTDLLEMSGYAVTAVDRGQHAEASFDQEAPDLVLTDVTMPDGDGYALLRHIRAHPTASDVPVIFLTCKSGQEEMRTGLRDGVDDYIAKPFDPDEVLHAIAQRIERRGRQLERLERLKISLGSALPAELRAPLCGILGYAELLRDAAARGGVIPAAEVAEAADAQLVSCERLLRLVDAVCIWLEVSGSGAELVGQYARARSADWVPGVRLDSVEIARLYGRERDLAIQLEDGVVCVPKGHWRTLICQLVDNAFKFSERGTPVRVTGTLAGGSYRLVVHDTGRCPGAPETGSLGPFQRTDSLLSGTRGLGLGISIVRQVAALAGGDFRLGPAADGGTEVVVVVPLSLLGSASAANGRLARSTSSGSRASLSRNDADEPRINAN